MEEKKTVKKPVAKKTTTVKKASTKTAAKKALAKKVEVKATPVKEVEKCECKECNCGCNCEQKLNFIMYLTAATLILVIILLGVVISNNTKSSNNTSSSSEESSYDVSMFEELNTTDAISKIKKGKKVLVYIGRAQCSFCVKFLPTLQKAQKEFGYKTIYIDINKVAPDDQEALAKFGGAARMYEEGCVDPENATVEERCGQFGLTPQVLIFEKGKLKDSWAGYSEYEQFASFLSNNGFKK